MQPLGVLATGPGSAEYAQLLRQWSDDVVFFVHALDLSAEEQERLWARGVQVIDGRVARLVVEADRLTGVELLDFHGRLAGLGTPERAGRIPELLERVRARAAATDGLLWGDGYDETRFDAPELPAPAELAEAAGGRPVYLSRVDGHQGLATADVLGGSGALEVDGCERGPDGTPTGVVRGQANHLARRHALARLPDGALLAAQDAALCQAARRGVTCVHEMAGPDICGRRDFELLLDRAEALPIEVVGYWGDLDFDYVEDRKLAQIGGDLFLDGSLGSHTAALSTPYEDRPDTRGRLYHDDAELTELYVRASLAGVQVGVHAIGDVAIGQALRCARRAVRAVGPTAFRGCRHRIEHVELLGADGADRMADLGLAASVQPAFDAAWGGPGGMYARRLGPRRAKSMNPFADLWRRGVPMGGSSDAHVTPLDPWHGVAAAVHHHRPDASESVIRRSRADAQYLVLRDRGHDGRRDRRPLRRHRDRHGLAGRSRLSALRALGEHCHQSVVGIDNAGLWRGDVVFREAGEAAAAS